jgi:hypothetical protein
MKRFLLKLSIYLVGILAISSITWKWMAMQPNNYSRFSHETNVKNQLERIQQIHEPKIVFIGGSGCGFGLCSPLIMEHFQMPVVNTGTHASLGLRMQLLLFKPFVAENDVVIVIPEYAHYLGDFYLGDETAIRILSSHYIEGYKLLNLKQQMHLLKYVPKAYKDARSARSVKAVDSNSPYSAQSLNQYGDVEMYKHRNHQKITNRRDDMGESKQIQKESIRLLRDFNQYCIDRGATMLIFPPAFRDEAFEQNKEQINEIWKALIINDLPIVSFPVNYELPDSLYYDTDYHLTYEGVIYRTNKLIADLDSLGIISH